MQIGTITATVLYDIHPCTTIRTIVAYFRNSNKVNTKSIPLKYRTIGKLFLHYDSKRKFL